jgi:fumarylpyruvate hydrolase
MTRRDLQLSERAHQRPWALGKDVENSAVLCKIPKAKDFGAVGPQRIHLSLNGEVKQDARLDDPAWKVVEIIAHLSKFYHLGPGDLIITGTPACAGPVVPGDKNTGGIDGLDPIRLKIGKMESCTIAPNGVRGIVNRSSHVRRLLVVIPYRPGLDTDFTKS